MNRRFWAIALLFLAGCSSEGERFGPLPSDIAPLFGGGGGSAPAPAQAPAQTRPNVPGTAGVMAIREQHGAVNQSNCYDMEARFKREGRNVRLVEVKPNDLGVGGVFAWICVFEDDGSGEANSGHYGEYPPQY